MAEIKLYSGEICLVDAEDLEWLSKLSWVKHYNKSGNIYAKHMYRLPETGRKTHALNMTNAIFDYHEFHVADLIDHIDGNGLNNQKSNLRSVTYGQNAQNCTISFRNTSGHKGVHFFANRWVATIDYLGSKLYLGRFPNKDDAIKARLMAENNLHGEFARPQEIS
jgi:hypothetical protein